MGGEGRLIRCGSQGAAQQAGQHPAGQDRRPKPLLCRKLKYKVTSYTPDMLFQGSLTAPDKQAAALGFKDSAIKTLETGCEAEIDFHMVDAMTVLFGLNDRVYTMTRRK